jgi:hypothetical protein
MILYDFVPIFLTHLLCLVLQDCDMPSALSSPDARPEAGVDQVDVMQFLGLKRVDSLSKKLP